jgi:hypothetical protein
MEGPEEPWVAAEVKSVLVFALGAAAAGSLDDFAPADPTNFGMHAQIFLGGRGDDLSDSFDVVVCSPMWMAAEVAEGRWEQFRGGGLRSIPDSIAVGAGIWFMARWDRAEFDAALRAVCEQFSPGPDWGSVAARVGRLIPWEFDHLYDDHVNKHYGSPFPDRADR